jgi:dynein heavy chain
LDALRSVSNKFLDELELGTQESKNAIIEFMPNSFDIVQAESNVVMQAEKRAIYITPKSFLELIKLYKNKLDIKRGEIEEKKTTYEIGVTLLEDIQLIVEDLNEKLVIMTEEVEEKKTKAEEISAIVSVEKDKVKIESDEAELISAKANDLQIFITKKKGEIEGKIKMAMPKVAETLEKLDNLKKDDVTFLKSLKSPDEKIKQTLFCTMHIFTDVPLGNSVKSTKGKIELTWNNALSLLKNPGAFINDLKTLGKELVRNAQVPMINFARAKKLIADEDLSVEFVLKKSAVAGTFLDFAINIIDFAEVMDNVGPMEQELADLKIKLDEANNNAKNATDRKNQLNAMLKELFDKSDRVNKEKEDALREAKV